MYFINIVIGLIYTISGYFPSFLELIFFFILSFFLRGQLRREAVVIVIDGGCLLVPHGSVSCRRV